MRFRRESAAEDESGEHSAENSASWTRRLSCASVLIPSGRRLLWPSMVRTDAGWFGARGPIGFVGDTCFGASREYNLEESLLDCGVWPARRALGGGHSISVRGQIRGQE